jgi:hypothetical protein
MATTRKQTGLLSARFDASERNCFVPLAPLEGGLAAAMV